MGVVFSGQKAGKKRAKTLKAGKKRAKVGQTTLKTGKK